MPLLIDTHCHIHFPAFDANRDELMARLRERDMWAITIGTGSKNSVNGIAFAEAHDGIFATVGLHPDHVTSDYHDHNEGEKPEDSITAERLIEIARSSKKCVAIGECGLDWYRLSADMNELAAQQAKQEVIFHEHLKAARELDLPLVIHCREALPRLAEILKACHAEGWKPRGVVHSFTGTWVQAQPLLDLGFHLGINGIATFPPKKDQDPETVLNRVIERMPLGQLVLETDAPYLAPVPHRGEQNEPAHVQLVAEHVAKMRGIPVDEVAKVTTENARKLFGF